MVMVAPKTILVRCPNWIGDQVLAYPFFHYLRAGHPRARIVAVCPPWVSSIQFRNLVDEVYVLPRPSSNSIWAKLNALEASAATLRKAGPWDLGISLPNSLSAAWLLYRAGCVRRRGYDADGRRFLLNEPLKWESDPGIHRAESYVRLLPAGLQPSRSPRQFWGVPPENDLDPGIPGETSAFDPAKAWLDPAGPGALMPPTGDYWVLAPGSAAEARRWPIESFVALAYQLFKETSWPVVLVGGGAEVSLAEQFMELLQSRYGDSRLPKVWNQVGQGPVSVYWRVFQNARLTVCNDSGLAHVAALCGSPVQITWGAGDPRRTAPIGPGRVRISMNPPECWPCERNICPGPQKLACLKDLVAEQVAQQIIAGWSGGGAGKANDDG